MRREVKETFDQQARWLNKMRTLIGPRMLREGVREEDWEQATDLVLVADRLTVACRLRPARVLRTGLTAAQTWPYDVTITCRRENGFACEWDKMVIAGLGDWAFYGHATHFDPRVGHIEPWYLLDLAVVRDWLRDHHGRERGPNMDTPGYRCWFYAFDTRRILRDLGPSAFIAARWPKLTEASA